MRVRPLSKTAGNGALTGNVAKWIEPTGEPMADRRASGVTGPEHGRTTAARATAIAELLQRECSSLLELYRKKETLPADVISEDSHLVSVATLSSQLDTRDQLWSIHVALVQCRSLMERAIAKEDEELGNGMGEYESLRKKVKERLSHLVVCVGELVKAVDRPAAVTPSLSDGLELDNPSLFELKLWVLRIFKEVDYWAKTAIAFLHTLPKERAKNARFKSSRGTKR